MRRSDRSKGARDASVIVYTKILYVGWVAKSSLRTRRSIPVMTPLELAYYEAVGWVPPVLTNNTFSDVDAIQASLSHSSGDFQSRLYKIQSIRQLLVLLSCFLNRKE